MAKKFYTGIDLQNNRAVLVGDPVADGDAANKGYVDSVFATLNAGDGLAFDGTAFSVVPGEGILADGVSTRIDPAVVTRHYVTQIGNNSSTSFAITHNLGTRSVSVTLYDAVSYEEVDADVTHTTTTTVTLNFAVAPAAGAYYCVVQG